jgi:tetracycline repressor-like protein
MSPRKPAVLRNSDGPNLRDHLIATAARLIDQRGSAGLGVRDIAREAQVADGVLYNYFEDKEDLLAHALLTHVGSLMGRAPQMLPPPGTGTVAGNLSVFIERGAEFLGRVMPAFAGLVSQPKVLGRFHALVGGDAAFGTPPPGTGSTPPSGEAGTPPSGAAGTPPPEEAGTPPPGGAGPGNAGDAQGGGPQGFPEMLSAYLRAEQRLGRIAEAADIEAASALVVGLIHGQVLPRLVFGPAGTPVTIPPGLAARLAQTVLAGIGPAQRG